MNFTERRFLMLQGPHGPFYAELARGLRAQGAQVWRAGLNAGDESEWPQPGYIAITEPAPDHAARLEQIIHDHGITDLVLYGDNRPFHITGLACARTLGVRCHILEEGYLRPSWITYERHGSNQRSPAAHWSLETLPSDLPCTEPPPQARWGALRQHIFYGAMYHLRLLLGGWRYRGYRTHRDTPVRTETARAVLAALGLPVSILWRQRDQGRLLMQEHPFIVLLMQLDHDSALRGTTQYADHETVLRRTMAAFAIHAPTDMRLVVKMHPLETRQRHLAQMAERLAKDYGLNDRLVCIPGGRLAPVLDRAAAAVTVNSTAGQQVLWRSLPLFAFAPTVYDHDALLPQRDLNRFMTNPVPPDPEIYAKFRAFLFRTSQIPGSFYGASGRAQAIVGLLDAMGRNRDPYDQDAAVVAKEDHNTLIPAQA